jgi:hypothetical protein
MESYDRGSAILVEVEFKEPPPFGTYTYFDPTSPLITVTDANKTEKVGGQSLTKSAVGKYYYVIQTQVGWIAGVYEVKVTASSSPYSDVTIAPSSFRLI